MDDIEITRAVSQDYRTAQIDFRTIVNRLHPLALSTFLLWLDHKVSEFKAFGHVILDEDNLQNGIGKKWCDLPDYLSPSNLYMVLQSAELNEGSSQLCPTNKVTIQDSGYGEPVTKKPKSDEKLPPFSSISGYLDGSAKINQNKNIPDVPMYHPQQTLFVGENCSPSEQIGKAVTTSTAHVVTQSKKIGQRKSLFPLVPIPDSRVWVPPDKSHVCLSSAAPSVSIPLSLLQNMGDLPSNIHVAAPRACEDLSNQLSYLQPIAILKSPTKQGVNDLKSDMNSDWFKSHGLNSSQERLEESVDKGKYKHNDISQIQSIVKEEPMSWYGDQSNSEKNNQCSHPSNSIQVPSSSTLTTSQNISPDQSHRASEMHYDGNRGSKLYRQVVSETNAGAPNDLIDCDKTQSAEIVDGQNKKRVEANNIYHGHPNIEAVKQALAQGHLPKPVSIQINNEQGSHLDNFTAIDKSMKLPLALSLLADGSIKDASGHMNFKAYDSIFKEKFSDTCLSSLSDKVGERSDGITLDNSAITTGVQTPSPTDVAIVASINTEALGSTGVPMTTSGEESMTQLSLVMNSEKVNCQADVPNSVKQEVLAEDVKEDFTGSFTYSSVSGAPLVLHHSSAQMSQDSRPWSCETCVRTYFDGLYPLLCIDRDKLVSSTPAVDWAGRGRGYLL
ncbi:hypothetical protein ScPMuIL_011945 [Solemya velum]